MKKTLTLEQILQVKTAIDSLDRTGISMDISGCISMERLSMELNPVVKGYERAQEVKGEKTDRKGEMDAYCQALGALQAAHAQRDNEGNCQFVGGSYVFRDPAAFATDLKRLKKQHTIAVEKDNLVESANTPAALAGLHEVNFEPMKSSSLTGKITWAEPIRILIRNGVIEG